MNCNHEKIKSVNCEIFCLFCGEKLPIDYLVAKKRIAEQKSAEKPVADAPADDNTVVANRPAETPENGENLVADVPAWNDTVVAEAPAETPETPGKTERKAAAKGRGKGGRK